MSTFDPRHEYSDTYIVRDRNSQEEYDRVRIQGELVTAGMGGPLPEQTDPSVFQRVLDVGCGAGDWLFKLAETYPTMTRLVGIDVNTMMINKAKALAAASPNAERLKFDVQDAQLILEFPQGYFDLVNIRFGSSFLRRWDWPKLLSEFRRVCRPMGVIRVTEGEVLEESSSPALLRLGKLFLQATQQAGHTFNDESNGVTKELPAVLHQHGILDIQTRSYALEYRTGTPEWESFYDDTSRAMHTFYSYMRKWAQMPSDYDELCKQALDEMRQPDFVVTWRLFTAWGKAPSYEKRDPDR
jgi:SAM-dependent methyltransferase